MEKVDLEYFKIAYEKYEGGKVVLCRKCGKIKKFNYPIKKSNCGSLGPSLSYNMICRC